MKHVLTNSYIYQKPEMARYHIGQVLGNGLLVNEEDKHKQEVRLPFGKLSPIVFTVLSAESYGNTHSFTSSCVVFLRPLTRTLLLAQRKFEN